MTNFDQHGVMLQNRKNVLDYVALHKEVSRQEICEALGSSMTTVLSITDYLISNGLLSVGGQLKTSKGRRPQLLKFVPDSMKAISVDYDAKRIRAAVCNYYGAILEFREMPASSDIRVFFGELLPELVKGMTKKQKNILGIGISMPGDFSPDGGSTVLGAPSAFTGIEGFNDLKNEFSRSVGLPVYCFNDGNAAAWGEYLIRDRADDDLVFIQAGDGLGAGMILDGVLRSGKRFAAGEIGYMVFDSSFRTDSSEPGWFESRLSKGSGLSSEMSDLLSLAIANVSNVLDVDLFVVNVQRAEALDEDLYCKIRNKVNSLSMNPVRIEEPRNGHPSICGAASLVINREMDSLLA